MAFDECYLQQQYTGRYRLRGYIIRVLLIVVPGSFYTTYIPGTWYIILIYILYFFITYRGTYYSDFNTEFAAQNSL